MTTPREMVALLQEALSSNIGVKTIVVDGQTITFADRAQIIEELKYWESKAAYASGRRKPFRTFDMGSL